jgi:ATP-dependent DNA helicase PIF1
MFSPEQQVAYEHVMKGHNVFITGPGGTGKSKWIKQIVHRLPNVQVCAMTGCAALLLQCDAKTLHAWAGIGLGNEFLPFTNPYTVRRWKVVKTLIVDEVSMLSVELFDMLDRIGRNMRDLDLPFGGIQLIFSGDFFQLPPVNGKFCFESSNWNRTFRHCVPFTTMFRQSNAEYQHILNEIRQGQISQEHNDRLKQCIRKVDRPCVRLVPTRAKAMLMNKLAYEQLDEEEHTYDAIITGKVQYDIDMLKKNVNCELSISLKIGTQVMCIVNLNEHVCNGSQGCVIGFDKTYPVIRFEHGDRTIHPHQFTFGSSTLSQLPLIYAWAITIHKSQGATLQCAQIDIGNDVFESGQTYVALSRVVDLNGLYLTSFDATKITVNPKVVAFYSTLHV